ncbi:hypothetical protein AK812_SmicGene37384 [Symbiodinium microadriaticum]|uniref:Uncharacterized protein n=1 Tax=Symbiodinium microadriaticum TaxID=2951 RepID=A0A1Q9CGF4_SYMMI|nr:hypothetical protein AK812_SmicGene37384 [Symbiodinium microadriaticum]CAE7372990.1 unnamed protein product [Symbiodinium microadriaticum]
MSPLESRACLPNTKQPPSTGGGVFASVLGNWCGFPSADGRRAGLMWEKVSGQFYALLIMVLHRRMKRDLKPCRDGLAYERFWDHRGFGKLVEVPPYQDVARQKDSASRHSHEACMTVSEEQSWVEINVANPPEVQGAVLVEHDTLDEFATVLTKEGTEGIETDPGQVAASAFGQLDRENVS